MRMSAISMFNRADHLGAAEEAKIFSRLKMKNGTFKLTTPSRFIDMEDAIAPFLDNLDDHVEILDIGASTGITTLDLHNYLLARNIPSKITATDLFIDAYIIKVSTGFRVLCDADGWPLQYDLFSLPIQPWTRRLDYLTLRFIPVAIMRRILQPRLRAAIRAGKGQSVQMITQSIPEGAAIQFVENDIMVYTPAFVGRFGLIRAANILNNGYFSKDEIEVALSHIRSYMKGKGSLLLVTRTGRDGANHGTLFHIADDGGFRPLVRIGQGSEVEHLVVELKP